MEFFIYGSLKNLSSDKIGEYMGEEFNLSGLRQIWMDAYKKREPTLAFELHDGVGRFVFMMFFAEEDQETQNSKHGQNDQLFVFLGNTNTLLQFKTYGSHRNGIFKIFVNRFDLLAIRKELGIQGGIVPFNINRFLQNINSRIPQNLPLEKTIETLRREKKAFEEHPELKAHVDESSKIYLIGPKRLPPGHHPREKTLRKLYIYLKHSSNTVAQFIRALKSVNQTVAWTDDKSKANFDIFNMMRELTTSRVAKTKPFKSEGPL